MVYRPCSTCDRRVKVGPYVRGDDVRCPEHTESATAVTETVEARPKPKRSRKRKG